jgi:heme/copper-type cytochrome/quinol oxidase subunit 1
VFPPSRRPQRFNTFTRSTVTDEILHSLVRRYIKTAIAFLVLGLAIGTRILLRREVFLGASNAYEVSAHTHAILVGFVMMMILGVALWLFPRAERGEQQYDPRFAGSHVREAKGERF